jgi:hypothetical protein
MCKELSAPHARESAPVTLSETKWLIRCSFIWTLRPSTPFDVDPDQRTTIMAWTTEERRRYAPAVKRQWKLD